MRNMCKFSHCILQKVQMKTIKVDMLYVVLLLFFGSVASTYATDCSPSIKNITCVCNNISLSCHGIQEDCLDVAELVANISNSFPFEKNCSIDFTIENISLNPNSSLTSIPVSFLKLGFGLSEVPDNFFSGISDSLHVLNLSSNNFDKVPSGSLITLKQLHTLDLSHNNISTLSKNDFEGLDNLRTLELGYNVISVLESDTFLNLPLLEMLHLDHNALVFLNSSAFKGLVNLNKLSISGNGFDSLKSESFVMLSSLKTLLANKNNLTDLENIQMDSVKLEEFSVQLCAIQGVLKTDSLKGLPGLTSADLSYNNITEVESFTLAASFHLKHLNLSYNHIRILRKNAFSSLFNLITLDLQHNEILVVPESTFFNLTRLKYLNLNNNKLQAFLCPYTADLFSLERIYLENNRISIITSGAFIYSQNLTELKLSGNQLNCSCNMYDFSTYLLNRTSYWIEDMSAIKCSSPSSEHGKSVINVDYGAMKCLSGSPCESQLLWDVDDDDDDDEEDDSTTITSVNDTNSMVSEIWGNFSTTDTLSSHSSISDNETLFSVSMTSSTDHTAGVPENSSSLPPNNTAVQSTTDPTDGVPENSSSLPPNNTAVQSTIDPTDGVPENSSSLPPNNTAVQSTTDHTDDVPENSSSLPPSSTAVQSTTDHTDGVPESSSSFPPNNTAVQSTTVHTDGIPENSSSHPPSSTAVQSTTDHTDGVPENSSSLPPNNTAVQSTTDHTDGIPENSSSLLPNNTAVQSTTDHTDGVPENFSSLPPNNTAVQLNASTTSEPTINPFSSTTVYNNPVEVKNYSLTGKKLCVEWEVSQTILGDVKRCLLKYTFETGRPATQKYIKCPLPGSGYSEGCVIIKATSVIKFCIQVSNKFNKVFAEYCVLWNETLFSIPQTSSTDFIAAMNTTSSINLGSTAIITSESTSSTPLGTENATDSLFLHEQTSTASVGMNSSSGGIFNYTVMDPVSSETSLLTQTSSPGIASEISISTSELVVTSESTDFSDSSSGPESTTKTPSVSGMNETTTSKESDFGVSTNATLAEFSTSTESDSSRSLGTEHSIFTRDRENFSSLPPNTTAVQSNDSTVSEVTVNPLSSTTVYNYPIDIKNFSLVGKELCFEWSVNQRILGNVWHCFLSYALGNKKSIQCPSFSSKTSKECLIITAAIINELCIQIMNRSNKMFAEHCVHEHQVDHPPTISSSSPVSHEQVAFNVTHLNIMMEGNSAVVKWAVNRGEPLNTCSLKLNIESNSSITAEKSFECTSNSYVINFTENNVVYEICLTSYHITYSSVTVCRDYYMPEATADARAEVKPAQYYTYAVLIGILVLVICFLAFLLVRAIVLKRSASDAYNVFSAEKSVSIRKRSEHQTGNQNHTRYSYNVSEAI